MRRHPQSVKNPLHQFYLAAVSGLRAVILQCCSEPGNGMILRTTSRVYKHIHILIRGERFDECSDLQHRGQSVVHAAFKHLQVIPSV